NTISKENLPKRLKASIENKNTIPNENCVFKNHIDINVVENNSSLANSRRKCGKHKQYRHYTKTCQNIE
ncbi:11449_t:CDS:1, partial [Dentiscutata erythropus]